MTWQDLIRQKRESLGRTCGRITQLTGLSRGHYWQIENGNCLNPGFIYIAKIARCLDIPLDDIADLMLADVVCQENKPIKSVPF